MGKLEFLKYKLSGLITVCALSSTACLPLFHLCPVSLHSHSCLHAHFHLLSLHCISIHVHFCFLSPPPVSMHPSLSCLYRCLYMHRCLSSIYRRSPYSVSMLQSLCSPYSPSLCIHLSPPSLFGAPGVSVLLVLCGLFYKWKKFSVPFIL